MSVRTRLFLNNPADAVGEMLEGYTAAHSDIIRLSDGMVVRATPKPEGHVGVVIGNGSGHEPAMIGWVGEGLFDVNVPGPIFSSPGPGGIVDGIRAADRGGGVLLLVSSHAGDIMNATLAIDEAEDEGIDDVEMVILYDDVASAPKEQITERRAAPGCSSSGRWSGPWPSAAPPSQNAPGSPGRHGIAPGRCRPPWGPWRTR